jgi:uncharacterized protein (UPF0179 family)
MAQTILLHFLVLCLLVNNGVVPPVKNVRISLEAVMQSAQSWAGSIIQQKIWCKSCNQSKIHLQELI